MKNIFLNLLLIASITSLVILSGCNKNRIVADFEVSETNVYKGRKIFFNDLSSNTPTEWSWDFGDGNTSTQGYPSHTYNSAGVYTVKLTVSNIDGSDTELKTDYITISLIGTAGAGLTDINGNTYTSIIIGEQEWMAENLKATTYPNGDAIPLVTDNTTWVDLADNNTDDAYCYYNNNASSEADTYGALYTYAAAIGDDWQKDNSTINIEGGQGVCPDGWHLPTSVEWEALEDYLGTNAGSKLADSADLWQDGALEQSADFGISGFDALPSGKRYYYNGSFINLGDYSSWWSSTADGSSKAYANYLYYSNVGVNRYGYDKSYGLSVRCVRD